MESDNSVSGQAKVGRRPRTTFEALGIPVGSELVFKNNSEIKCVTVDAVNTVTKDGVWRYISALASEINHYPSSGYEFFTFSGQLLSKMREELDTAPPPPAWEPEPVVTGPAEVPQSQPPQPEPKAEEAAGPKTHWTPGVPSDPTLPKADDPFNI
jgi:hypothetical protein